MPLSPEALARIAEALPDTYDTDPDALARDWQAGQSARQDLDRLRPIDDWYTNTYQPWYKAHAGDFQEFETWKQRGDQTPEPTTTPAVTTPGIDFTGEEAARQVHEALNARFDALEQRVDTRVNTLAQSLDTRADEMTRLLGLQEQAYGIILGEVYNKIEPGWAPAVNIPKVVEHAQQHNIGDLRQAYSSYTQADREKAMADAAYRRGLEEGRRAAAAASVTTEQGGGSPFHRAPANDQPRGYNRDHDVIVARAQALRASRGVA